jgi:hypothetical protein
MNISLELTDMGLVIGSEEGIMSLTIEDYGYKKQAETNSDSMGV